MTLIIAMASFALSMSISPGPVNLISLSTGARSGVLRTLPFVAGATTGFTLMLFIIGLGAGSLIEQFPELVKYIGYGGAAFILYLAIKIITAKPTIDFDQEQSSGFTHGAILQFMNPKAWIACLSGGAAFISTGDTQALLQFCLIYFVICFGSVFSWAVIGAGARRLVQNQNHMQLFNAITGSLLALVAIYLFVTS